MNSRKQQNKQTKPKSQKQRRNLQPGTLVIPRSVGAVMPDKFKTTLRWWKAPVVNLASSTTAGLTFNASGAFDPDPTSGSTTPSGFNQLGAFYFSYRVKASRIKVDVVNPDPVVPVTVSLLPVNLDPGTTPTANYVISSVQNPYAKHKILSIAGSPPLVMSHSMTTAKIFGSKMTDFDDNFAALISANPVNMWFWFIGFYSPAVLTQGVVVNAYLELDLEFYDRRILGN